MYIIIRGKRNYCHSAALSKMPSRIRDAMRRSAASSSSAAALASAMARTLRLARQSGSLNLSSRDFHSFPDEVFRLYELLDEDEHSWECAVLRKLDLR